MRRCDWASLVNKDFLSTPSVNDAQVDDGGSLADGAASRWLAVSRQRRSRRFKVKRNAIEYGSSLGMVAQS